MFCTVFNNKFDAIFIYNGSSLTSVDGHIVHGLVSYRNQDDKIGYTILQFLQVSRIQDLELLQLLKFKN